MNLTVKKVFTVVKNASKAWWFKDPFKESAVIAYYAIFSLPGLLVLIVSLAGYFFGEDAINNHLADQITSTLGADTAEQVQNIIIKASEAKNSILASILGLVTILVGATGVFVQFQKSINTIWEVKIDETKSNLWKLVKIRLFSFGLIVSIAFILVVSLVVSAMLSAFSNWLAGYFTDSFVIELQVINYILSLATLALLFAFMFKVFPDAKIQWRHVWIGSVVTALLFEIGKFSLALYFGKANPGIGYGAAGSVILIMLWVSYSSMIVFFGAEFTHAFAKMFSGRVIPSEIAVIDKSVKDVPK